MAGGQIEVVWLNRGTPLDAYMKDVDRTLLYENLKLTVEQRLDRLMALQKWAAELRTAGKKAKGPGG